VLHCLAGGLSNRQIAEWLFISLRTVEFYIGKIFAKLGMQTRTQAILRLRELETER
jgi:DNA-binding NarL/FixJ family response regulator